MTVTAKTLIHVAFTQRQTSVVLDALLSRDGGGLR